MRGLRLQKANQLAFKRFKRECNKEEMTSNYYTYKAKESEIKRHLGKLRKTTCSCSCWMCRNLRKIEGPTIQEIKQNEKDSSLW